MIFATLIIAYLLGSIPFGLLLTRAAGMGDVRKVGSGNIGATNVLRAGSKKLAALTLLLDMLKGFAAVRLGYELGARAGYAIDCSLIAAVMAVVGHIFPIWLRGRGGKGVATAFGVYFALLPLFGAVLAGVWLAVFAVTRYVSLASVISLGAAPIIAIVWAVCFNADYTLALVSIPIALLVIWRHKENILRLKNGTEHRFGAR